jgi:hypothetical protein
MESGWLPIIISAIAPAVQLRSPIPRFAELICGRNLWCVSLALNTPYELICFFNRRLHLVAKLQLGNAKWKLQLLG